MRAADRGAAGRWQATGTAGQHDTCESVHAPATGRNAGDLLDLHRIVLGLLGVDVALLAVMVAGWSR